MLIYMYIADITDTTRTQIPMPKLIDYPRTNYSGAWELAEITDDTGGKCAIETAARKLNRKVSGSFKAIIGSAVKFGLITSKRDLLTTTTLFKRIKHAYDKQEELLFHREAFLNPPLFTQVCRKFRSRELPVQMLDVMLIREFGVEEINAPGVAKAFVEGCRMVGLLNDHNIVADIDALNTENTLRKELSNPTPRLNTFRSEQMEQSEREDNSIDHEAKGPRGKNRNESLEGANKDKVYKNDDEWSPSFTPNTPIQQENRQDAIANLFGLIDFDTVDKKTFNETNAVDASGLNERAFSNQEIEFIPKVQFKPNTLIHNSIAATETKATPTEQLKNETYQIQISGPGINTILAVTEEEDLSIAIGLLEKIRRQLKG